MPGPVELGMLGYSDQRAVGPPGWVPGEVGLGRLGSESLSVVCQPGSVSGGIEPRGLVSVCIPEKGWADEGPGLVPGVEPRGGTDEGPGSGKSGSQGWPGVGQQGWVSGPVDLGRPGSKDWFV